MGKLQTPEWVLKGYKSKGEWEEQTQGKKSGKQQGKMFRVRVCPKCNSRQVSVVLGEKEGKGKGEWECKKCKWKGEDISFQGISEDEFLKISKGEN